MKTRSTTFSGIEGLFDWYATYEELNDAWWCENRRVFLTIFFYQFSIIPCQ